MRSWWRLHRCVALPRREIICENESQIETWSKPGNLSKVRLVWAWPRNPDRSISSSFPYYLSMFFFSFLTQLVRQSQPPHVSQPCSLRTHHHGFQTTFLIIQPLLRPINEDNDEVARPHGSTQVKMQIIPILPSNFLQRVSQHFFYTIHFWRYDGPYVIQQCRAQKKMLRISRVPRSGKLWKADSHAEQVEREVGTTKLEVDMSPELKRMEIEWYKMTRQIATIRNGVIEVCVLYHDSSPIITICRSS